MKQYKNRFTVLFLKENFSPQSFKFSYGTFKKMAYLSSFLFVMLLISISISIGYFVDKAKNKIEKNISISTNQIESKDTKLTKTESSPSSNNEEIENLKADIKNLEERIRISQTSKPIEGKTALINKLYGQTVKTPGTELKAKMEISNFKITNEQNDLIVTFNLTNKNQAMTVTGFINVIAETKSGIHTYPNLIKGDQSLLAFTEGETFQVSRFRQVRAEIPSLSKSEVTKIYIYIFNNEGVLLNSQELNGSEIDKK